jgi:hypothetical protein
MEGDHPFLAWRCVEKTLDPRSLTQPLEW